jgi:hypothetical protein
MEFSNCMYDDPIYARVINLILIFFLLICFRTNAPHGVWGTLRLSHNTSIVQLPLVFRKIEDRRTVACVFIRSSFVRERFRRLVSHAPRKLRERFRPLHVGSYPIARINCR